MTKLLFERGNIFTGDPWGVVVHKQFGSTDLHGPFSSENEAWNYGMRLAKASDGTEDFNLVKIETTDVRSIATGDEIRNHRNQETTA